MTDDEATAVAAALAAKDARIAWLERCLAWYQKLVSERLVEYELRLSDVERRVATWSEDDERDG
jgi:hypothetical protein